MLGSRRSRKGDLAHISYRDRFFATLRPLQARLFTGFTASFFFLVSCRLHAQVASRVYAHSPKRAELRRNRRMFLITFRPLSSGASASDAVVSAVRSLASHLPVAACLAVATASLIAAPRAAHAQYNASGVGFPWQGHASGVSGAVNTATGNRTTVISTTGWAVRGGKLSVGFTLYHNSNGDASAATQTRHDGLSARWSHSYALYVTEAATGGAVTFHRGDDTAYTFTPTGGGVQTTITNYAAPAGVYDKLVKKTLTEAGGGIGGGEVGGGGTGGGGATAETTYELTTKAQIVYTFKTRGGVYYCTQIKDRNNNAVTIARDTATGRLLSVSDPNNRQLTFAYDGSNRLTSVTNPESKTWTLAYNANNDLASVATPLTNTTGSGVSYATQVAYNATGDHRLNGFTDKSGRAWTFGYDTSGRFASETDALSHTTGYAYASGYVNITNARGYVTRQNYDTSGRLASVVDPKSFTVSYARNAANNVTQVTDQRGKLWNYTYDARGNVLSATDPLAHVTAYEYNAANDKTKTTTPLGSVTQLGYDTAGNCVGVQGTPSNGGNSNGGALAVMDTLGSIQYDGYGQVVSVADGLSHATTYQYDSAGNAVDATDPLGHKALSGTTYDTLGRRLTAWSGYAALSGTNEYDALGRTVKTTAPGNRVTAYEYDGEGRVTKVTNPLGQSDNYLYDAVGRLQKHVDAAGVDAATYTYNANDNRIAFVNGNGVTAATYTYNERDEVTQIAYPDSGKDFYTYNPAGQVASKSDLRNLPVAYVYDDAGRLLQKDSASQGTLYDVSFTYDADNRKTAMTDSTGTTTYAYDAAGKLLSRAAPGVMAIAFGYDANGQVLTQSAPVGSIVYQYDAAGRQTSVKHATYPEITFAYDNANRVTATNYTGSGATRTDAYNASGDLADIWHKDGSGATIARFTYQHDALGRRTQETLADGSQIAFDYDAAGRLTEEGRSGANGTGTAYQIGYTYDGAGNRLTKTLNGSDEFYHYNAGGVLLTDIKGDNAAYSGFGYDAAGNSAFVYRDTASGASPTSFSLWSDPYNRLSTITNEDTQAVDASYGYNGLGQRVRQSDANGLNSAVYRDDAIDSPMIADSSATYVWGPNGIVSELRNGVINYYHGDALGTTRAMTTQGRTQTDTRETDAFGNLWGPGSNLATPTPFGYAGAWGYQTDADSGLMLLGHRYYDASVGRFISRDPAQAGYNWYVYTHNDPVNWVDPEGLDPTGKKKVPVKQQAVSILTVALLGLGGFGGAGNYNEGEIPLAEQHTPITLLGEPLPGTKDPTKPKGGDRGAGGDGGSEVRASGPNWGQIIGIGAVVVVGVGVAILAPELIPVVAGAAVRIVTGPGLGGGLGGPVFAW